MHSCKNGISYSLERTDCYVVKVENSPSLYYQDHSKNLSFMNYIRTWGIWAQSEFIIWLVKDFWPNMYHDIEHLVTKVCPCLKQRHPSFITREPLQSLTSSSPFDLVSIDFLHLEQSSGGYECVLVIMDHFTRFAQTYATKNKSAHTAASKLFN